MNATKLNKLMLYANAHNYVDAGLFFIVKSHERIIMLGLASALIISHSFLSLNSKVYCLFFFLYVIVKCWGLFMALS